MAEIRFNLAGFSFQEGLERLRAAFEAATLALASDIEAARDAVKAYVASVDGGASPIGEWEEDGTRVWDQEQVLEHRLEAVEEAAMGLRKAFALAIYHHWERAARGWTGLSKRADHEQLRQTTLDRGYPIDARLEAVRHLANVLKHNKAEGAAKLAAVWPELLPGSSSRPRAPDDWYEAVELSDDHIRELLRIVAGSGPTVDMLPTA